jgi:hypothetical protein
MGCINSKTIEPRLDAIEASIKLINDDIHYIRKKMRRHRRKTHKTISHNTCDDDEYDDASYSSLEVPPRTNSSLFRN